MKEPWREAGFFLKLSAVISSICPALEELITSMPWSAAGISPTAAVSLVLPPTQSTWGGNQPTIPVAFVQPAAFSGNRNRLFEIQSIGRRRFRPQHCSSSRGTARFGNDEGKGRESLGPISARVGSIPSGSVLSKKWTASLSRFGCPRLSPQRGRGPNRRFHDKRSVNGPAEPQPP